MIVQLGYDVDSFGGCQLSPEEFMLYRAELQQLSSVIYIVPCAILQFVAQQPIFAIHIELQMTRVIPM